MTTNPRVTHSEKLRRIKKPHIAPIIIVALITVAIGTVFYMHIEGLTLLDAIYFCVMTLTTVGYSGSSVEITTAAGKIFTIFYVIFGVVILAAAANYILHQALEYRERKKP